MKWFWRIYKIDGSFQKAFEQIGGININSKNLSDHLQNQQFLYAAFDGTFHGTWKIYEAGLYDNAYNQTIESGYEFKGNIGIKEIRKEKLENLEKNAKIQVDRLLSL